MRSIFDTGKAGNQLVFAEELHFRVLIPSILLKTELSLRYAVCTHRRVGDTANEKVDCMYVQYD